MSNNQNDGSGNLAHFGVLGMKWGVRKNRSTGDYSPGFGSSKTVKFKNGTKMTIDKQRTPLFGRLMAKMIPKIREDFKTQSSFKFNDSNGKTIGEMMVYKEGNKLVHSSTFDKSPEGKAIAKAGLRAAEKLAKENGLKTVKADVWPGVDVPRDLYKEAGYTYKEVSDDGWGRIGSYEKELE